MAHREESDDPLLTPAEVAAMFKVNSKTVTRWAMAGKIKAIRTLGGHRRFRLSEVRAAVASAEVDYPADPGVSVAARPSET